MRKQEACTVPPNCYGLSIKVQSCYLYVNPFSYFMLMGVVAHQMLYRILKVAHCNMVLGCAAQKKKMVVQFGRPIGHEWTKDAPARYPSTAERRRLSLLCEASLTRCPPI